MIDWDATLRITGGTFGATLVIQGIMCVVKRTVAVLWAERASS